MSRQPLPPSQRALVLVASLVVGAIAFFLAMHWHASRGVDFLAYGVAGVCANVALTRWVRHRTQPNAPDLAG